jgi:hypothetical protein
VKQQIDELLREMPEQPPFPVDVVEKDGLVALLTGYDDPAKALAGNGRAAIAQAAGFSRGDEAGASRRRSWPDM